jgi:hypothetical protein
VSAQRPWDFGYAPATPAAVPPEPARSFIVATSRVVDVEALSALAASGARAEVVLARAPLFWTRLELPEPVLAGQVEARLAARVTSLRYVASAERPSLSLAPALEVGRADLARPVAWRARRAAPPDRARGSQTGASPLASSAVRLRLASSQTGASRLARWGWEIR